MVVSEPRLFSLRALFLCAEDNLPFIYLGFDAVSLLDKGGANP